MQSNLILVEYNPAWKEQYDEEIFVLKNILKDLLIEDHHIGSTAVPGLMAKPIIDILGVVSTIDLVDALKETFDKHGYEWMGEHGIAGRRYIVKPNRSDPSEYLLGTLAHIHLYEKGAPEIGRHLGFKNYLLQHPEIVEEYNLLKQGLLEKAENYDQYQLGKCEFIKMIEGYASKDD